MFFSEFNTIKTKSDVMNPGHTLFDYSKGVDATVMVLVFAPLICWSRLNNHLMKKLIQKLRIAKKLAFCDEEWNITVDINENLGDYWQCLTGIDQKRWLAKQVRNRKCLNIRQLDDDQLTKLRTAKRGSNWIHNICNYDILSNFAYADALNYT